MHPLLYECELWGYNIPVLAYTFFTSLAAVIVLALSFFIAVRRGLPAVKTLLCLLTMAAFFVLGARIYYLAANLPIYRTYPELLLKMAGFSLSGGLVAAPLAGLAVCRYLRLDLWRLADAIAPALGLGIAVARVGCFLNGCCFGNPTTVPWGIIFPPESGAAAAPAHPTQLYELIAALAGAALAFFLLRRRTAPGTAFAAFFLWFITARWAIFLFRAPEPHQELPPLFTPLFFAALTTAGTALLLLRLRAAASAGRKAKKTL
ncbi:MAG: prolipoprotein diacylglyceryl transferase family protein [Bacillota bacterium]